MTSSVTPQSPPEISVVVPTYQRSASVLRLLRALDRQTLSANEFEVVVVVDGSTDRTLEHAREHAAAYLLKVIWKENGGRASSCNVGIRAAAGRIVVLLDDDMEPTPAWLSSHLMAHQGVGNLGVVGAAPIRLPPEASGAALFAGRKFNDHLLHLARKGEITGLREFYSGNFSISRETILSVGGFDEAFRIYGNEDVDLGVRLRAAGVRLVYSPEAVAYQAWEKTSAQLGRDSLAKGRTAMLLACKHPDVVDQLRVGRLENMRTTRRLLVKVASYPALNRALTSLLLGSIGRLEGLGLGRWPRFYALWTAGLFWLGALAARAEQGRS